MKRIFLDLDRCDGCKNCSIACMQAHREGGGSVYDLDLTDPANESRNAILLDGKGGYVPLFCRHCDQPECVSGCISGALTKDPETGLVLCNEEQCAACFMCVMNCPYGVLRPDRATHSKPVKCDFCREDEQGPNCVRSCPTGALEVREVEEVSVG